MTLPLRNRLSIRLTRTAVGVALLLGLFLGLINAVFDYFGERDALKASIDGLVEMAARPAAIAAQRGDEAIAQETVAQLLRHEFIVGARVVNERGEVVGEARRAPRESALREGARFIPGVAAWQSVTLRGVGDPASDYGHLVVVVDRAGALAKYLGHVLWELAFIIMGLLAITAVLHFAFERVMGNPLAELIETFRRLDPNEPEKARLPVVAGHEDDEIGLLSSTAHQYLQASRDFLAERKWAEEDMKERERRLHSVAENLPGIVFQRVRYPDGRFAFTYLSSGLQRLHGLDPEKVVADRSDLLEIVHPDDREQHIAALNDSAKRLQPINMEMRHIAPDGDTIWIHTMARPYRVDSGAVIWDGLALDVTERKRAQERIHYLAQYDTLTGLLNREWFLEHLRRTIPTAKRAGQMLAVLFLDLDDFKGVNDSLGHGVGDLLLKAVADRLQSRMRKSDTVTRYGSATVSRLGGDEFTIILSNLKKVDGAATAAQRIIKALGEPFTIDGNEIHTGSSIGIAIFPDDGETADELLKNADLAMYRSKANKVNKYHFYVPEMNAEVMSRKAMEGDLRDALTRGELWLCYQPQVEVATSRIVGMEALLRWTHPERGAVSPVDIIPIAEQTNLIIPIGEWVLREACSRNKAWQDEGLDIVPVSVNVSAAQIEYQNILGMVEKALSETGLDPSFLHIEVTESVVIRHQQTAMATLRALREIGIKIYLDDFGTGYSSLSYLRRFPIDNLKIDRTFINEVTENPDDAAITRAIIVMAHTLNMEVTAEGVETEEQFNFLRNEDCDLVQGHYFSRPVPAEAFGVLLKAGGRIGGRTVNQTGSDAGAGAATAADQTRGARQKS